MIQIKRKRYIVVTGDEKKIFCGLARNYELKEIDNLGDTPVKTYMSEKKQNQVFYHPGGTVRKTILKMANTKSYLFMKQ